MVANEIINAVRGTREFYPEEMAIRSWLYQKLRGISTQFGYQEYDGPFLESLELYAAKSGEELVKEQSFVFPDRGGNMIALRPELTPSLARMVAQRQRQLVYPLRWWSFGPMWRYERPGKGRTREFYQWNIDLIGAESAEGDAELVAIAAMFLREVGFAADEVQILVNNRQLIDDELLSIGIPESMHLDVIRLIDRRDKMRGNAWQAYAMEVGLDLLQFKKLKTMLDKDDLWQNSADLCQLFDVVDVLGVREYVRFAPYIVRGLDYYTDTVFEAWDTDGEFRAILGGGRYGNLVQAVGGEPISGVGFAMGDVVLPLVLQKFNCLPAPEALLQQPVLVTVFDAETNLESIRLASEIRKAGIPAAVYPCADKLRKQLKYADRIKAPAVVIAGPDELAQNQVTIKDLRNRTQQTLSRDKFIPAVRTVIA
jgi:histidyl-tRNA synthetase